MGLKTRFSALHNEPGCWRFRTGGEGQNVSQGALGLAANLFRVGLDTLFSDFGEQAEIGGGDSAGGLNNDLLGGGGEPSVAAT